MNKLLPPLSVLEEYYDYSIITGEVRHKRKSTGRIKQGELAGSINREGYWVIKIQGVNYILSRIIWKLVTGEEPGEMTVEHINRLRDNNAWHNLTLKTIAEQQLNTSNVINSPYPLYVTYHKQNKKFVVQKRSGGKIIHYSTHNTLEEASEVASRYYKRND